MAALPVLARSLVMFVAVYVGFRVFGKRMMAELTPMDRVAAIAYGTIAGSTSITKSIPLYAGVLGIFAFAVFAWAAGRMAVSSQSLRTYLVGRPKPLVVKGEVDNSALRRAGLSREDLWMRLRELKVASMYDVELAQLEPDGKLGLVERKSSSSKTKSQPDSSGQKAPSSAKESQTKTSNARGRKNAKTESDH